MNIKIQNIFQNRMIVVLGFGLGGMLWGLEAYRGTVGAGESFTNPFSYVLGAVAMAVFGGLSLAYLDHSQRLNEPLSRWIFSNNTLKIVGLGGVGWLIAFFLPAVWMEWMLVLGGVIQLIFVSLSSLFEIDLASIFNLQPSLVIFGLWLEFLLTGAIIGLVYSLVLKSKIVRTVLWSSGGFALAALIGPIFGNLIGNFFDSLFVSYLVTFLVIGVTFGKFLSFGICSKEKEGSTVQ